MRRPIFLSIAILLLIAPVAQGAAPPASSSVVGGRDAAAADWPSIAFVLAAWDGDGDGVLEHSAGCTGTVIAPDWILSAAHCAFRPDGAPIDAILSISGAANHNDPTGEVIVADRIVVHPGWSPLTIRGDALLLHLEAPSSRTPMPMALPGGQYGDDPNRANVAGWGKIDEDSTLGTDVLQAAHLDLIDDGACAGFEFAAGFDPGTQKCAGTYRTAGVCHGDSGGPLTVVDAAGTPHLWGVTSYGPQLELGLKPCSLDVPAVFTWVPAFAPWVDETMRATPPATPVVPVTPAASGPAPPADRRAPVLSRAKLSARRIAAARRGATLSRRAGAKLTFVLSEAAAVRVTVLKRVRALAPAPTIAAQAGRTTKRFTARLGGKALERGRYRLRLAAVDAAGNAGKPVALRFRVVR